MANNKHLPAYPVPAFADGYSGISQRTLIAAMCLQGLLSNPAITTQSVMGIGGWPEGAMGPALEAADRLLFHLQNTDK